MGHAGAGSCGPSLRVSARAGRAREAGARMRGVATPVGERSWEARAGRSAGRVDRLVG